MKPIQEIIDNDDGAYDRIGGRSRRTPTMEQDPEVVELASKIFKRWMTDDRWRMIHLHMPGANPDCPIAYFWAELAAKAALSR